MRPLYALDCSKNDEGCGQRLRLDRYPLQKLRIYPTDCDVWNVERWRPKKIEPSRRVTLVGSWRARASAMWTIDLFIPSPPHPISEILACFFAFPTPTIATPISPPLLVVYTQLNVNWIVITSFIHYINNMSFSGPIPELETVQEEKETRSNANVLFKKSKKRSFTILEQEEVIETSKSDYTPSITLIYRSFQLHYFYMTSWELVQLFLFLIQSVFNLLFYYTNEKVRL